MDRQPCSENATLLFTLFLYEFHNTLIYVLKFLCQHFILAPPVGRDPIPGPRAILGRDEESGAVLATHRIPPGRGISKEFGANLCPGGETQPSSGRIPEGRQGVSGFKPITARESMSDENCPEGPEARRLILPLSLKTILSESDYGAVALQSDDGAVLVLIRVPDQCRIVRTPLLEVRHFIFFCALSSAPVVGWYVEVLNRDREPVQAECYFDVRDPSQASVLNRMVHQPMVPLYAVTQSTLEIVGVAALTPPPNLSRALGWALDFATQIPSDEYDFGRALSRFQQEHPLAEISTWNPVPLRPNRWP